MKDPGNSRRDTQYANVSVLPALLHGRWNVQNNPPRQRYYHVLPAIRSTGRDRTQGRGYCFECH